VADVLSDAVVGLRTTHVNFPDNDHPPYHNILPTEAGPLLRCCEAAALLNAFFCQDEAGINTYNQDDVCLKCLTLADPGTDEDRLRMAVKSCGGDIETARTSLFNERIREINHELDDWKETTVAAAQMAICEAVCDHQFDPDTFPEGSEPLREWISGWLTDRCISTTVKAWFADQVQEAKAALSAGYDAEVDSFRELCASSLAEQRANLQAETERDFLAFKHTLKIETDQLKDHALRACNKASLETSILDGIKAALSAEAQADLAAFTATLKSDAEKQKEIARKQADAGVKSAVRVASGSHKSIKSSRPSHSTRPTPRLMGTSLPLETIPSSQTPPEMTLAPPTPSLGPLSPITTSGVPVPFSPHKRAQSESTTPTPRDPAPPNQPLGTAPVPPTGEAPRHATEVQPPCPCGGSGSPRSAGFRAGRAHCVPQSHQ
jgi:hypothetical protein